MMEQLQGLRNRKRDKAVHNKSAPNANKEHASKTVVKEPITRKDSPQGSSVNLTTEKPAVVKHVDPQPHSEEDDDDESLGLTNSSGSGSDARTASITMFSSSHDEQSELRQDICWLENLRNELKTEVDHQTRINNKKLLPSDQVTSNKSAAALPESSTSAYSLSNLVWRNSPNRNSPAQRRRPPASKEDEASSVVLLRHELQQVRDSILLMLARQDFTFAFLRMYYETRIIDLVIHLVIPPHRQIHH